jgi:hypothetical protein
LEVGAVKSSVRGALIVAVALMSLAVAPVAARAAGTFYAKGGGGNTGAPCTEAEPCNLAKAVEKAETAGAGSAAVLLPGPTYTPGKTLMIKGAIEVGGEPGQPRPTIQGAPTEGTAILSESAVIHDVNLIAGSSGEGIELNSHSTAVRVYSEAITDGDVGCLINTYGVILDSVCVGRGDAGLFANVIVGEIVNVTAISGKAAGIEIYGTKFSLPKYELTAVDSIAVGGDGYPDVVRGGEGTAQFIADHSDFASVGTGITVTDRGGNIATPPQFVNPAAGDFHQLSTSPTIDAGVLGGPATVGGKPVEALDLDRNPRALNAHPVCGGPTAGLPDIGAFEFVPTGCTPPPPPPLAPPGMTLPAAPNTKLGKAKIDSAKGTARFSFSGTGSVSGYKCVLVRPIAKAGGAKGSSAAKGKGAKPKFAGCRSPKTYKHLKPGRYTFKVEATGPGGTDSTPAARKFRIAS